MSLGFLGIHYVNFTCGKLLAQCVHLTAEVGGLVSDKRIDMLPGVLCSKYICMTWYHQQCGHMRVEPDAGAYLVHVSVIKCIDLLTKCKVKYG